MKELTAENVDEVFRDCLFQMGEEVSGAVLADGIQAKFGFHPGRIDGHSEQIAHFLAQLPEPFHQDTGGGWSFLKACFRADGQQWGEHINVEQLMVLGLASGAVQYAMPRDMWKVLPGGMPYFVVVKK